MLRRALWLVFARGGIGADWLSTTICVKDRSSCTGPAPSGLAASGGLSPIESIHVIGNRARAMGILLQFISQRENATQLRAEVWFAGWVSGCLGVSQGCLCFEGMGRWNAASSRWTGGGSGGDDDGGRVV